MTGERDGRPSELLGVHDLQGGDEAVLEVRKLTKQFAHHSLRTGKPEPAPAVGDISFSLRAGETLGIVGESGSGKSTTARLIMGLHQPTSGSIHYRGIDLTGIRGRAKRRVASEIQMIFQDPFGSLNPRLTVEQLLMEPLRIHGRHRQDAVEEWIDQLLRSVGLRPDDRRRLPHEFSGGQRQRIAIARGLVLRPKILLLDEPVSSLDVSIQAQILNVLKDLQELYALTYVFISHDLSVVRYMCDRIIVMQAGVIVEEKAVQDFFEAPSHPYSIELLQAVPALEV